MPRLLPFSGFVLNDGRRGGICWDEKPRCVTGHRLVPKRQRDLPITEGIVTCIHRESREAQPCDVQQWAQLLTAGGSARVQGSGERAWLVVEITREHIDRMRREPMIFLERMVVLGVALPGVDLDVLGAVSETPEP